jgi:hypothetical protein
MAKKEHLDLIMQGVDAWNNWRATTKGIYPDLSGGTFTNMNLSNARLYGVNFSHADLSNANLTGANLTWAFFVSTHLKGTVFSRAELGLTVFSNVDLSGVKGLETVHHSTRSYLDVYTFYESKGGIPEIFLRGCGIPENFITYIPALVAQPIQFYSCFISYSNKDQEFAERLYSDLQSKGVRCWFAPEDLRIGDRFRDRIDESIRLRDKLLLILSENSISSSWVEYEVESAFEEERKSEKRRELKTVLLPIRLDGAISQCDHAWASHIRRTRHIGDFSQWKNHDVYQKSLNRLLRDLTTQEPSEAAV